MICGYLVVEFVLFVGVVYEFSVNIDLLVWGFVVFKWDGKVDSFDFEFFIWIYIGVWELDDRGGLDVFLWWVIFFGFCFNVGYC